MDAMKTKPDPIVTHPDATRRALRTIALFEAAKGVAALAAIVGVLRLVHHDVRHLALELIGRFGLSPETRYPSILLHYADLLPGANVRALLYMASAYILLRVFEAYGLWNDHSWGEWLAALSGAIYIPFEVRHLLHRPSVIGALVLGANVAIVGFLVFRLWRRKHAAPVPAVIQVNSS